MAMWGNNRNMQRKLLEFLNKGNCEADLVLLPYNCKVVSAHSGALHEAGILNLKELRDIQACLLQLEADAIGGNAKIELGEEDSHTKIENCLIGTLGETGKKVHIGKSRNDEALAVLRLYEKDKLKEAIVFLNGLIDQLSGLASEHNATVMPGYTHMKKAMPSTFGYWCEGFEKLLEKDVEALNFAISQIDYCPIGTAAGYGSTIDLDWEGIAHELELSKLEVNGIAAQNSRMKEGALICGILAQTMMDVNKMATDLMLWNTEEFGFVELDEGITTGSSMMPHKKNPDALELLRTSAGKVFAKQNEIQMIALNLPSGYNKDHQEMKKPLIEAFEISIESLEMLQLVLGIIKIN
ncbi:MAG: lyase family protein, partial [Candidatus Micrarchaeota archaeon]